MDKCAFITSFDKFIFWFMPFGLVNAPSTFHQRLTNVVLVRVSDFATSYIDDIVIYSQFWEENIQHIRAMLKVLAEAGLTVKPSKCKWATSST